MGFVPRFFFMKPQGVQQCVVVVGERLPSHCSDVLCLENTDQQRKFHGVSIYSHKEWMELRNRFGDNAVNFGSGTLTPSVADEPGWYDYVLPPEYGMVDEDAILLIVSEITGVSPDAITLKKRS